MNGHADPARSRSSGAHPSRVMRMFGAISDAADGVWGKRALQGSYALVSLLALMVIGPATAMQPAPKSGFLLYPRGSLCLADLAKGRSAKTTKVVFDPKTSPREPGRFRPHVTKDAVMPMSGNDLPRATGAVPP